MIGRTLVIVMAFFIAVPTLWAAEDIREGEWEVTTKMEMPGMPMQMPAHVQKQCMSKKDMQSMVPNNTPSPQQTCENVDYNIAGNTVTWTIKCTTQGGEVHGNGKIVYSGDRFAGTTHITVGGNMQMKGTIKGKWIGPCAK